MKMKTMKKAAAAVLALAMALSLAACGGGGGIERGGNAASSAAGSDPASAAGASASQIVVGTSMAYTSLDPAHSYEGDAEMVLHAAYNTLVRTEPQDDTKILPCAASDWTISDDGLTYVFTLNQGVVFTSGKEMKAEDVVYCLNRLKGIQGQPVFPDGHGGQRGSHRRLRSHPEAEHGEPGHAEHFVPRLLRSV